METEPRHYPYLHALRGYAVLGVINVHLSQHAHLTKFLGKLAASGRFGVQLFFVVSAITLMMSWNARNEGAKPFYIRRLFRIAPMFWLAIPFYVVLSRTSLPHFTPEEIPWWHFAATVFFVHGWHPLTVNEVVPGGWTIAVEMTFYIIFPILAATLVNLKRAVLAAAVSFVIPFVGNISADLLYEPSRSLEYLKYYWFPNQLPVFLIGIAAYHAIKELHAPRLTAQICVLVAAVLLIFIFPSIGIHPQQFALAYAILAFGLAKDAGTLVVNKPIIFLGKLSYSAYLTHFAALALGVWMLPSASFIVLLAIVLTITIVVSWACYTTIETFFNNWGKSVANVSGASLKPKNPARPKRRLDEPKYCIDGIISDSVPLKVTVPRLPPEFSRAVTVLTPSDGDT